jgi:hypothetical protein
VFFLKSGGKLFVTDMMSHDGNAFHTNAQFKRAAHTAPHKHGFTENEMKEIFEGAGLTGFPLILNVANALRGEKDVSLFLAHGTKPE